jgi:hypothetical protein
MNNPEALAILSSFLNDIEGCKFPVIINAAEVYAIKQLLGKKLLKRTVKEVKEVKKDARLTDIER